MTIKGAPTGALAATLGAFLAVTAHAGESMFGSGFETASGGVGGLVGGPCVTESSLTRVPAVTFQRSLSQSYRFGHTYAEVFEAWGTRATAFISMAGPQYASLPFTIPGTAPDTLDARLRWSDISDAPRAIRVSVSRCIGPPEAATAISTDCFLQASNGGAGGFSMKLSGLTGCRLQRDVPYYFNFAFADSSGQSACPGITACRWATQEQ